MEAPNQIRETFNVERVLADHFEKLLTATSPRKYSKDFQVAYAKKLVDELKIPELPYVYPETKYKQNGKSHGISDCQRCGIQTYQTATKNGWICDRCGNDCS